LAVPPQTRYTESGDLSIAYQVLRGEHVLKGALGEWRLFAVALPAGT
jgi:hypothetical protein